MFKQEDIEVHVPSSIFASSTAKLVCGSFLEIGKDKYACVVLRCRVRNGSRVCDDSTWYTQQRRQKRFTYTSVLLLTLAQNRFLSVLRAVKA